MVDFSILESGNPINIAISETGKPVTLTLANGAYSLNGLNDVVLASPTSGQVLTYNGSGWVNSATGAAALMASLGDVSLANLVSGELLSYNGSNWENANNVRLGDVSFSGSFIGTPSYVSSSPYTVGSEHIILADDDTAGSQILLSFPTSPQTGTIYNVKKLGSTANVVLSGTNVTFDGESTFALTLQYEAATVVSYGSGYYII